MIVYYTPPFLTPAAIDCADPQILRWLRLKYGIYLTDRPPAAAPIAITVSRDGALYRVCCDGTKQHTATPTRAIADLLYEKQVYPADILAFHGGAVAKDGQAYLFLAATTSGKTTLTTYLTEQGFSYLTDDCIVIDRDDRVHPFATPVHLRLGGYEVLKAAACPLRDAEWMDDPSMMRYVFTPENRATEPLPLARIFLIVRTDDSNRVEAMSTTDKMTALMRSPIQPRSLNAAYLSRLSALCSYPCDTLYYKDLRYVQGVIERG